MFVREVMEKALEMPGAVLGKRKWLSRRLRPRQFLLKRALAKERFVARALLGLRD